MVLNRTHVYVTKQALHTSTRAQELVDGSETLRGDRCSPDISETFRRSAMVLWLGCGLFLNPSMNDVERFRYVLATHPFLALSSHSWAKLFLKDCLVLALLRPLTKTSGLCSSFQSVV